MLSLLSTHDFDVSIQDAFHCFSVKVKKNYTYKFSLRFPSEVKMCDDLVSVQGFLKMLCGKVLEKLVYSLSSLAFGFNLTFVSVHTGEWTPLSSEEAFATSNIHGISLLSILSVAQKRRHSLLRADATPLRRVSEGQFVYDMVLL